MTGTSVALADLGGEPVEDRCGRCGKKLVVDLGAGLWGQPQAIFYCLGCGVQPEAADWTSGLTAALAVVLGRREG